MIYRDDDVSYLTNVDELKPFHQAFVDRHIPHTLALECEQLERNHAVCNFIKANRVFDLQIHGWRHTHYARLPEDDIYRDLMLCREFIADKFGHLGYKPYYFYPPWNEDSQEMRRAAARAGLIFDNHRVEARDYLRGDAGRVVNLHYWQDMDIIGSILDREYLAASPARKAFHKMLWDMGPKLPRGADILFVGKTHVYEYDRYFPGSNFSTLDIDPAVKPTICADIQNPPPDLGQFDLVGFFGVWEVLEDPFRGAQKAAGRVKPGGRIILGVPLAKTPHGPSWLDSNPNILTPQGMIRAQGHVIEMPYGEYWLGEYINA